MSNLTPGEPAKAQSGGWGETIRVIVEALLIAVVIRTLLFQPFSIPSGSLIPTLLIGDYLFVSKYSYGYSRHSFPFSAAPFSGRVWAGEPQRGDIAVFKLPKDNETDYIKRVIGLPGDLLEVRGGVVYLNGVAVKRGPMHDQVLPIDANSPCTDGTSKIGASGKPECHLPIVTETLPNGRTYDTVELGSSPGDFYPATRIPKGHVFLMGDNRDRSADSRFPAGEPDKGLGGPVPWENLGGRAEFITFSVDGSSGWNPISWFTAFRSGRAGTSLHPKKAPAADAATAP